MIRTVIIEDEIPSQQLLSTIVNEYCPYLQLVGVAESIDVAKSECLHAFLGYAGIKQ
jgi:hypothetical protein